MKLVYVLTTGDGRAGTEKSFADQTAAMARRGHEVTLVSLYRWDEPGFDFGEGTQVRYLTDMPGPDGEPSLVIPREWDSQFCRRADLALQEFFRSCEADVVITSTPALLQQALLGLPDHVRVLTQEHRSTQSRGILAEPILRHGPQADAVAVLTERTAAWLREQWGPDAPRIDVVPNALPATGRPVSGGRQKVVMGAGRFVPSKGFADLIRAFSRVSGEFPDWRLRLFGDGPQRPRLVTLARNLGIADRVEFMGTTTDIEAEWSRASIGALASRSEGLPLVLLEARGAGLPVVAYDCETGPREILEHGRDGFLVDVGAVDAFADCLRLLMGDEALRRRMGERAEVSLERFRPEAVAEQWSRILEEIVAAPLSARRRRALAAAEAAGEDPEDGEAAEAAEGSEAGSGGGESAEPDRADGDAEGTGEGSSACAVAPHELTPPAARERTRAVLEEAFAGTAVRSRPLLESPGRPTWAVPAAQREGVLRRFREIEDPALEVRLYAATARLDTDGRSWREDPEQVDPSQVRRLYAYRHYEVPGRPWHLGYAGGLHVEFWEHDEARPELLRAGRRNLEIDLLRPEQFDAPLFRAWEPMRGRPLWSVVDFPVDAVYMWVDGSDPQWRARKAQASGAVPEASDLAGGDIRFLNRDELRYSLRSLAMHAPWIRRIHLVTDRQRPEWLVEDERLRVVDHREIFPDPGVLPVFNSQAIEACLHRIPDLAEHFLVLNDDGFFLREQRPEQYFSPAGRPRFFPSPTKINDLGELAEPHEASGMNNRRLLEERHGVSITQGMLHSPLPHRRSYVEAVAERYRDQVEGTRRAKFRSSTDVSLLSSLTQYSGYLEGEYEQGALRVSFVSLGTEQSAVRLAQAGASALDFLTFGEAQDDPDPELTQEMATNFMRGRFPVPSPWERV